MLGYIILSSTAQTSQIKKNLYSVLLLLLLIFPPSLTMNFEKSPLLVSSIDNPFS